MKTKATFVFLIAERKIHAHSRQTTMDGITIAREGDNRKDRSIPPARLTARKRKGKSMLYIIDEEPPRYVSGVRGNQIKGDT
jgi:hypothetical protein